LLLTYWNAQHAGDAETKDVGVYYSDASPELVQRQRQIDAHCGFSDALLTTADGDDMSYPWQFFSANAHLGCGDWCLLLALRLFSALHGEVPCVFFEG
jgi:hypothetical protein